ncbi:MAG: magnesium-translocating P-type ATPase [Bifidobacteriaceae bacterium]|nr:magnesium-translocating P-type ATPase [Bifidobacteriaceae bacterium]
MANDVFYYSKMKALDVLEKLNSSFNGLDDEQIELSREINGNNKISKGKKSWIILRLFNAFINPFTVILIILASVSSVTDIILAPFGQASYSTVIIIATMVFISGILRFIQETRSGNAAERLSQSVETTCAVQRLGIGKEEIPLEEVVVGDIVYLAAGDIVPADVRIIREKDLFINESSLTGESEPREKSATTIINSNSKNLTDLNNMAFLGTTVVSGSATCIVVSAGDNTVFGKISSSLNQKAEPTSFEKGVNSVSWILIRFMLVMVPLVLFINGFTKGDWLQALLFAISVAVGLTPEMLPMIVTTALSRGAVAMGKKDTIIKSLNAIQNLGSMDILCTDKTGTLTQDKVVLEYHLDIEGKENNRVLRHAFLNSYYQTGLKNLMDLSIIETTEKLSVEDNNLKDLPSAFQKVDEIPFDFERRRMSVVVQGPTGKTKLITKGAVEEMLSISKYVEYGGKVQKLTENLKKIIIKNVEDLNDDGMRVVAIAQKNNPPEVESFSVKDESNMILIGILAFLDPPKESAKEAIGALDTHGVGIKILTGDNERVTANICSKIGIDISALALGSDIDKMTDEKLVQEVEKINIFAKLSPLQKKRIVQALRGGGHTVGYMGDGINDALAMKASDAGISVDTAVDVAKESARVILLKKDLGVLEDGIIEGRKTYGNMIKYIKMTVSSNFGNIFSVLIASAFLPFLPMSSIQLLLLNLIYDITCTVIPWDNVDKSFLARPRSWDSKNIARFMIRIGPISSIFDIITFALLYFYICPAFTNGELFSNLSNPQQQFLYIAIFQTGWFIESMWSQTFIIHLIRTNQILPFIKSRPSFSVAIITFFSIIFTTLIPFTNLGRALGLVPLEANYFIYLTVIIIFYCFSISLAKRIYIRKYNDWL